MYYIHPVGAKQKKGAVGMSRRLTSVLLGVPCEVAGATDSQIIPSSFRCRSKKNE